MGKKGPPFIRADEPAIYRPLASGVGGKGGGGGWGGRRQRWAKKGGA